jgi:hypothetical protein
MSISSLDGLEFSLYDPGGRVVSSRDVLRALKNPDNWIHVGSDPKFSSRRRHFKLVYMPAMNSLQQLSEELTVKEPTARVPEGDVLISLETIISQVMHGRTGKVAVADPSWRNKTRHFGEVAGTPHYPALFFRSWCPDMTEMCSKVSGEALWVVEIVR